MVQVTILARECGADAILEDLAVDSLVPEPLRDSDVATFLEQLPQHDSDMAKQLDAAQASGDVLRYVGKYDAQKDECSITLARYPASHPFAALNGTDNIVQIRTERYDELPLIIRGPGAGGDSWRVLCGHAAVSALPRCTQLMRELTQARSTSQVHAD
jgi:homoserine dehydrogenase